MQENQPNHIGSLRKWRPQCRGSNFRSKPRGTDQPARIRADFRQEFQIFRMQATGFMHFIDVWQQETITTAQ